MARKRPAAAAKVENPHAAVAPPARSRLPELVGALGLVAATAAALRPAGGVWWGHDIYWQLCRIAQWHVGVQDGVLWPRFFHDVYWGHGGPVMVFNPPAPYLLTELFVLLGAGTFRALELGLLAAFVAGGGALYLFARDALGRPAALLAGAAYAIAPYRLLDGWVRAAYPELLATALVPLLLLGARRLAERVGGGAQAAGAGLLCACGAALLVLTHAPTTVFGLPLAGAYGLWHALAAPCGRRLVASLAVGAALALGVGLGAFYWMPALAERDATSFVQSLEFWHYGKHFLWIRQLFETRWGFGHSVAGPEDGMSFQLGWVHAAALLGGALLAWRGPPGAGPADPLCRELRFWLGATLLAVWLMNDASEFLWARAPLLSSIQFPWRLLVVPVVATSLCVGALLRLFDGKPAAWAAGVAAGLAALVVVSYAPFATSACQSTQPVPAARCYPRETWDGNYTPEALRVTQGADSIWLPRGAPRGIPPGPRVEVVEGSAAVSVIEDRTHRMTFKVTARGPAAVRARIFDFPGWRATLDGVTVVHRKDPATAAIVVDVPEGDHEVSLRFGRTPAMNRGLAVSLASLLAGALGLARARFRP